MRSAFDPDQGRLQLLASRKNLLIALALAIVLAVGGAMMVPYIRSRAEVEGFNGKGGLMGRAERVLLFTLGLIFGLVEPMLWVFVVLVWITVLVRFVDTYRSLE